MSVTPDELRAWLGLAEDAARRAGEFLVQSRVSEPIVTAELGRDVKLEADWRSEERILQVLRGNSGLAILTEERGLIHTESRYPGLRWIVDPLDGSLNYLKGIPLCCVSVALWQGDEPLLGVIYDFNRNELFTGIVGVGAWLNQAQIHVSHTSEPERAVLCTGFPVSTDFSCAALVRFVDQVRKYKKLRLFGSAALSLAYVAAGRADAYYERDIKIWDVAAGLAIVRAAGGTIVREEPATAETRTVYASNPLLPRPDFE